MTGPAPGTPPPRVAVVGRPNVGKSTLVNRILGRRAAITEELPGVTRDRVRYEAEWAGRRFELVDTGGWEPHATGLGARVVAQAERAMREADVVLLVVDATVGVTEHDAAVAAMLQRGKVPVLLVANKVDAAAQEPAVAELWSLGVGEPYPVSSLHGRGVGELLDALVALLGELPEAAPGLPAVPALALVGRPNVGKSSLLNRLGGEELAIVHDAPGTTRDAVDTIVERDGRAWRLVDTAGIRRAPSRAAGADYYALVRSLQAVDRADLALLVLDASEGVAEQDLKVAARALAAGCALVLVANKWDLVGSEEAARRFEEDVARRLRFVAWAPLVRTSAVTGRGMGRLWEAAEAALAERGRRVPTAELNEWLAQVTARTPPPMVRGRQVKVRYATQARTAPPQVVLFATGELPGAYRRYLERELRRAFGFAGTPVRLAVRVRDRQRAGHRP